MMIKLDNGYLLNQAALAYVDSDGMVAYFKKPVITNENSFTTAKRFGVGVTKADIERIAVSTANSEVTDDDD
ncbi:hypothetical protein [Lacticaseibacillus paracasei]|uniref:hypothetical protein n=1 Tax=Lacticaseibacillus paracasei TaxID=1597 RepID=UPI000F0B3808|nr:hypothetical protein [Lacticaseibacillus paracasei]TLQ35498.1 hypothetical protein FEZ40_11440 [Lacticaseibacillus paracasei]